MLDSELVCPLYLDVVANSAFDCLINTALIVAADTEAAKEPDGKKAPSQYEKTAHALAPVPCTIVCHHKHVIRNNLAKVAR